MACYSETIELRTASTQTLRGNRVNYYAHTAEDEHGNRLPESSGKWQPLAAHLRNVAALARAEYPLRLERGEGRVRCRNQANWNCAI